MSEFGVTIEKISKIRQHTNADRLEIAELEGKLFQFVIGKDTFNVGDYVFYFPVDSIIPENTQALLGVTGRLSGSSKNRLRTVRLRGEISQGLVAPLSIKSMSASSLMDENYNWTEDFGVTKYEPPITFSLGGGSRRLPEGIEHYDIESAQRKDEALAALIDMDVQITEKIEGTHFCAFKRVEEDSFRVCSRTLERTRGFDENGNPEPNLYLDVIDRHPEIKRYIEFITKHFYAKEFVAVRGEIYGNRIQGNIYGLNDVRFSLFDVIVDGEYLTPFQIETAIETRGILDNISFAPVLFRGKLRDYIGQSNIVEKSNGLSVLSDKHQLREGIVIKPYYERVYMHNIGRLILKVRSPEYLSKVDL